MVADHTEPWNPPRSWADPLIALLGVLIVALLAWRMHVDRGTAPPNPDRISAQARIIELRQAAKDLAKPALRGLFPAESLERLAQEGAPPWDRALLAVLAMEEGDTKLGSRLALEGALPGGSAFRTCFQAAYLAEGASPSAQERMDVQAALRNGYAAHLLEARLQRTSDPGAARITREAGRAWALPRLAGLALTGLALLVLVPAGVVLAILLACSVKDPRPIPLPEFRLSGRALALALLGWFAVFLSSGQVVGSFVVQTPLLRPYALPLIYAFHASLGLALLCGLEGVTLGQLRRRLMPEAHLQSLAWGVGFLALAVLLVLVVSLALSPFLRSQQSPQRELMDLVAGTGGLLPLGLLFLTVAVVAPLFEECLFRGTLLPWLGHRLERLLGPWLGWSSALVLSGLGFGLIHLQPAAMPVLSTLGLVLGLAFLHTRNLWTAVLVHGLWNGGVFLFYRVVLG